MVLHSFLKMETRERSRQARERSESHREKAMTGLPVSQQEALAATIFGRGTSSASRTDAQNRFLKSHLEMGYPQHGKNSQLFAVLRHILRQEHHLVMAIDEAVAARSGKVIQRDGLGLPMDVGTTTSSKWPSETRCEGNHSNDQRSSDHRSSSSSNDAPENELHEHPSISTMPSHGTVPKGERPPVRYHVYSGWAKQTKETSEQQRPRMHPRFEPEASRDPIVIKGFDPAEYAALQPKVEPITSDAVSEQLRRTDLGNPHEISPILQPFAGNVARSPSAGLGYEMAGNAYQSRESTGEDAVASEAESYENIPPIAQGFDLSKSLPDPSSAELDAAFFARWHTSSSDESEKFQSQVIHSSFLAGPELGNDSLASTLQPHHSLLSELLEGAASGDPDPKKTVDGQEKEQKQPGPSSSADRSRSQSEDSAVPPNFFENSEKVIRGVNSPLLRDEQEKLNSSGMHMDWYDRLP